MNDINELAIVLTARLDELQKGIDQANSDLKGFADKTDEEGKKGALAFTVAAAAIAEAGAKLGEFMESAAMAAARTEGLSAAMYAITNNMGLSRAAVGQAVEGIQALGYTEEQAVTTVTKMARAHLDAGKAVDLARVALDYADASGQDYGTTLETLSDSVERGNARALRQMGITANLNAIYTTYALTIGKTTANLTDADRQQATFNAVMEHAKDVAGAHNAVMQTAEGQIKALGQAADQAKDNLGKGLLEPLATIAGAATALLNAFNKLSPVWRDTITDVLAVVAGFAAFIGTVGTLMTVLPMLSAAVNTVMASMMTWNPILLATMAAIAALNIGFTLYEQHLDRVAAKMLEFNHAVEQGRNITTKQVFAEEDPRKALEMAKERVAFDQESLANNKGLTDFAKVRLQTEQQFLETKIKSLEQEVAALPPLKQHVATLKEMVDHARNFNITQKTFADDTMTDILSKEDKRFKMEGLNATQQVAALEELDKKYKLSAEQRMQLAQKIADIEMGAQQKAAQNANQAWNQVATEFASAMAQMADQTINIFGNMTGSLDSIWQGFVNKMVTQFIESGILSFIGLLTGTGSTGLFGAVGNTLGFDNPINDAKMYGAGGKWFSDALNNFSKGYVDNAVNSPQTAQVFGQAAAAAGSTSNKTSLTVTMPMLVPPTPAQQRQLAQTLSTIFRRNGVQIA